jgi:aromatic-amino-acid transaminase
VVRRFADAGGPLLVSNSFSKSFSLYGERVGALSVVAASAKRRAPAVAAEARGAHQLLEPACARRQGRRHRAVTPELRQLWEDELAGMRVRIKEMREAGEKLKAKAPGRDFASCASRSACSRTRA